MGEAQPQAFLVDIPLCTTEAIADFNRGYVEKHAHYNLAERGTLMPEEEAAKRLQRGGGRGLVLLTRQDLDEAERAKRAECARCRYDGVCEGVWKNYLKRNGWDEFVPVPLAAP